MNFLKKLFNKKESPSIDIDGYADSLNKNHILPALLYNTIIEDLRIAPIDTWIKNEESSIYHFYLDIVQFKHPTKEYILNYNESNRHAYIDGVYTKSYNSYSSELGNKIYEDLIKIKKEEREQNEQKVVNSILGTPQTVIV